MMAPFVRILLRYGAGALFGTEIGNMLVNDPDVVNITILLLSAAVGVGTEVVYVIAKKKGWST